MKVRNNMDKDRFFDRIDKIEDIGILSEQVCKEYNLGDYIDTSIIEIGYEDFNAIITTSMGKYFMKVFRNSRDDEEVREVIERAYVAEQSGVRSLKVLKNSNENIITNINYNNSNFRLAIMEYIEGSNFFQLDREATLDELLKIADLASEFGNINYKPNFIYDTWAISSFIEEFDKKKQYVSKEYMQYIQPIYDEFWVVDFSVSNYTARLNEIAVASSDFAVIEGKKQESEKRIKAMFERWAKNVGAIDFERNAFQILFRVQNAIDILNPSYEIAIGNNSEENKMYLELGKFGLTLDVDMSREIEREYFATKKCILLQLFSRNFTKFL